MGLLLGNSIEDRSQFMNLPKGTNSLSSTSILVLRQQMGAIAA